MAETAPATAPAGETKLRNIGPDGETIVDMSYYELLNVNGDADDITIKKAYRKAAIKWHPDKNPNDPTAASKFQDIAEAYRILSDSNLRAAYNRQGLKEAVLGQDGEQVVADPGEFFSRIFGGKAFDDWTGDLMMAKELSKSYDEEQEEARKEGAGKDAKEGDSPGSSVAALEASTKKLTIEEKKAQQAERRAALEKKRKDYERIEQERRERIEGLVAKLRDRIRPFVEARNPDDPADPEVHRFAQRMREEGADLALESFGIEKCHLIGEIYAHKGASYIKLHKKPASNILGVPGMWSRMKEKGSTIKEGVSLLSAGLEVQSSFAELEKKQAKGELSEDDAREYENDVNSKILLIAWKGSRFELASVLRAVVDGVLSRENKSVTDKTLLTRAKALILIGNIFKELKPDIEDDERRELERMVEEAAKKRKEKKKAK